MTRWDDYVSEIRQLDAVRRDAAAAVARQQDAASSAQQELGGVRQRIALQRSRLTDVAGRLTRTPPAVDPLPVELSAASTLVEMATADPTPGINAALKGARAILDAADATLSVVANAPTRSGPLPGWPPTARNALVYGWYALLAVIALVTIRSFAGDSPEAGVVLLGFTLVVPVSAWLLAWLSIGLLFGPASSGRKPRSSLLGAAICFVSMFIGLILSVL